MKHAHVLDVLVVYTDGIATSANDMGVDTEAPFSPLSGRENYNLAYAFFLETCRRFGLTAGFTTSGDIVDAGLCSSYWTFQKQRWHRVQHAVYSSQIFDKFSPLDLVKKKERETLFSSTAIRPFNNAFLSTLFFDKLLTYTTLKQFAIPTIALTASTNGGIRKAVSRLRRLTYTHGSRNDFSPAIIMKDRFGAGGNNIFRVKRDYVSNIRRLLEAHKDFSFVIQPFMNFEKGFAYKQYAAATDIRLIYQNGRLIQTYIRMAKASDFRCNEHQGGSLVYVRPSEIPLKVRLFAETVTQELRQDNSLYALDFIVSNNGNVYFLEGNIGPGLDWNLSLKKNERMSKRLIRGIVRELARRVDREWGEGELALVEPSVHSAQKTNKTAFLNELNYSQ